MTQAAVRVRVGSVHEFAEGHRVLVPHGRYAVGVFRVDGEFRAYRNVCLHQGGPVCEGRYFPLMTAVVDAGGRALGERYDESEPHLVCPWHGWEYDLRTGEFCGDRRRRLRSYPVTVEGEDVYVVLD
ncbi:Rieske (2Fe-2S) protein [Pseudonocardia acaciae]|uniref:Rieske (2Fe-2S) protein n=1 Tax=Pseudonocardia acaciae TaxID=551276 RepID=UPI00048CC76B|nr:Rieske (2Fe-2S) protein [Pseudonocardia acaciae]